MWGLGGSKFLAREVVDVMFEERSADIERGLELIPRLGEIMPDEAGEEVQVVYQDVRDRLRVPFVNFVFRVLANYPEYLEFAWGRISPYLLTRQFEQTADDLRVRALPEAISERSTVEWDSLGNLDRIRMFTDTIHYALPKLLLVATALDEGLGGASGISVDEGWEQVEPGAAEGTGVVPMVSPDEADARLQALFRRIKDFHGHPDVASYYRGLANWPDFLEAVWQELGDVADSGPAGERKLDLLRQAGGVVGLMPLPTRTEAVGLGLKGEDIRDLRAALAVFRFRVIPDTFVEVALIKAFLDGPDAALMSRFSFA
ncbi:hypothetical protein BH24ACT21_BH24ACT21_14970 [soil metagenome]